MQVYKLSRIQTTETIKFNGNLILVLDVSGSMSSNNRLTNLKKVSKNLVEKLDLNESTVSIVTYESSARELLKLSTDKTTILSTINGLTTGNNTSFNAAISVTENLINSINNNKQNYIIFISDGTPCCDSSSSVSKENSSLVNLKNKSTIYSIGVGSGVSEDQLKIIASSTDNYYYYNESDNSSLDQFYSIFSTIINDIIITSGADNPETLEVSDGIANLGNISISSDNPVKVYYGTDNTELVTYSSTNTYLKKSGNNYYFYIYDYVKSRSQEAKDMVNYKISYYKTN